MRTGGCKFARRCIFHHPDPTAVVGDSFQDRKNGVPSQLHDPVEQLCESSRPSENTLNEQTAFLGPFTPNWELLQNVHRNGNQTITSPLHLREMNIDDQRKTFANKDTACEFSGGVESQQFEEYPQRPSEPECQYFMKTGYCKFKSACRYHHPKSNVRFLGLVNRPASNNYHHRGPVEQMHEMPLHSENTSNEQTAFLGPSSSYVPNLFTPNQGLKPNAQWNEIQTATSQLHSPEIKIIDQQKELANKDSAYEFSGGEPRQFDKYPLRPSEPECQYFMKTGYCKFKSACRYHHPKSTLSILGFPLKPASNNYEQDGLVEQLFEIPLPSENTSNEQTAFLYPSSSNVPDLFTTNLGLQPNVQWNGDQMTTSPLHPSEIKINEHGQELANKDTAYEFSGGVKPQKFDEYPERPGEPECQYFLKTGYCKFKSACRCHHPKSSLSFPAPSLRPRTTSPLHPPEIKINEQGQELANKDTAYEFSGGVKSQQFDEYPQRPGEPECQYFIKTGYCKFRSACRCHHPKSNLSFPAPSLKPMATSPLYPPEIKINEQGEELANKDTAYEFSGGVKPRKFDEYPQRPGESECQYFLKTGYCKFKSACRCHHPKSSLSFPAPSLKTMATSPLHPPDIKINEQGQELANKDTAYEFSDGVKSQNFDEYPQRPSETECQYFMKTGYRKFKSAWQCHHPKSNLSSEAPQLKPDKPVCTHYSRRGICKFGSACRFNHHMEHT